MTDSHCRKRKLADSFIPCDESKIDETNKYKTVTDLSVVIDSAYLLCQSLPTSF